MTRSTLGRTCMAVTVLATLAVACATTGDTGFINLVDGGAPRSEAGAPGTDATLGNDAQVPRKDSGPGSLLPDGSSHGDASAASCGANATDLKGCTCPSAGTTRPCYPNDVSARNEHVGACKPGTQTCEAGGEFSAWGACVAAVTPTTESCTGTVDSNCNGKVGCADPTCATNPACMTVGCTSGQTRSCYDGPSGTENTGTCKDGTQICQNGKWPSTCSGEVLPSPTENCCDPLDHNCNGLPGCFDFLSCFTNACCSASCTASQLSAGCVCPTGSGDSATCPIGDHLVSIAGSVLSQQCCPCTGSDCGDLNCCAYAVCSGSSSCAGIPCVPASSLPASCNNQVSTDCDDWPEDCDEPCCLCSECTGVDGGQ